MIVHFFLNLSHRGRFSTVSISAATLYSDRLKGLNQSTYNIKPTLYLELKKPVLANSFQILPS